MTRIISGRLRGRRLAVPPSDTRPTSDRVREAVFNAIVSRVDLDAVAVLDLFAGSGALGIEAVSRGAGQALFIEQGSGAVAVLKKNLAQIGAAVPSVRATVRRASLPTALVDGRWLARDALVVWERSRREPAVRWTGDFEVVFERTYGETVVEMARQVDTVTP